MRSNRIILLMTALVASAAFAAKPVLKVNNTQLTDTDVSLAEKLVTNQMQGAAPGTQVKPEIVLRHAVDQLIGRTLLLQAAREAKTTVEPVEVAAVIDQQKSGKNAAAFDKYLKDSGLSEQDYTRKVEDQMVVRKFVESTIANKITISDTDAKAFYDANPTKFEHPEEVRLRTILVKVDPNADEKQLAAAKERAELARKRVNLGEDMASVARDGSDDPSKARGGDIGWVRKGMLLAELEASVWAMKPGELSPVLKTSLGYHVFKVEDRRIAGKLPFDDVKTRLIANLKNEKLLAAIEVLVKERWATAKLEALDPSVKVTLDELQSQAKARPTTGKSGAAPAPNEPKKP